MQFGDSYFLQLIGTAMGTSAAVVFANLYFGWHERKRILPKYQDSLKRLGSYSRFIDDVYLMWLGSCDSTWHELIDDFNDFGILKWDVGTPGTSVDFLDLTLTIEDGRIKTKTFQKANNPYLYIPPHSAHTPSIIKGTVRSLLSTYFYQNSEFSDFKYYASLLFKRLQMQGWDPTVLRSLFSTALHSILDKPHKVPSPAAGPASTLSNEELLFLHMEFHPGDIPRRRVRELYSEECEKTLEAEVGIKKFILAYSRPKTLGNIVAKAKLYQQSGREVSKLLTGELT